MKSEYSRQSTHIDNFLENIKPLCNNAMERENKNR